MYIAGYGKALVHSICTEQGIRVFSWYETDRGADTDFAFGIADSAYLTQSELSGTPLCVISRISLVAMVKRKSILAHLRTAR